MKPVKARLKRKSLQVLKSRVMKRADSARPSCANVDVRRAYGVVPPDVEVKVLNWPML